MSILWSGAKIFVHRSGGSAGVLGLSDALPRADAAAGGTGDRAGKMRLAANPRDAAVTAIEMPTIA
jgi:hypothetical protein